MSNAQGDLGGKNIFPQIYEWQIVAHFVRGIASGIRLSRYVWWLSNAQLTSRVPSPAFHFAIGEKGATVLGICNVVGSSIPRETHAGIYTHAGPEIGVASTKAFTTQVMVLVLMALWIGKKKGTISNGDYHRLITELELIAEKIEKVLIINNKIEIVAQEFKGASNFLYLGRGYNFPVALEGALKLKEISYIHAEGYPAAEMKHGPIALIDDKMPIVVIATKKGNYQKVVSNIQEVKARGGRLIAIVTEGDQIVKELADYYFEIPNCAEELSPLLSNIPLQLLSYHIAVLRGCNVDQPRNLAKSVTVE